MVSTGVDTLTVIKPARPTRGNYKPERVGRFAPGLWQFDLFFTAVPPPVQKIRSQGHWL
jgi:hypothetical protein